MQVTTVAADRKQLPIALLLTLVSATDEPVRCVRSVVAGNVIVIWLPAMLDRPPVEEVVNAVVYATFPAPGSSVAQLQRRLADLLCHDDREGV